MNADASPGVLGPVSALPLLPLRSFDFFLVLFVRAKEIRFLSHLMGGARKCLLSY